MPGHRFLLNLNSPASVGLSLKKDDLLGSVVLGQIVKIDGDEGHHLRRVLRLGIGDEVNLFDGIGHEYRAEIVAVTGSTAEVKLVEELVDQVESPLKLTLVQGLIKGDKFDLVIQKAVELGVSRLQPLVSRYTDLQLSESRAEKRLERWQRIALEATKQCGRRELTEILPPINFNQLIQQVSSPVIFFAERGGQPLKDLFSTIKVADRLTVVVGCEGGWHENERQLAKDSGFYLTTLGRRILRAETAGITAVALLQHLCGDL